MEKVENPCKRRHNIKKIENKIVPKTSFDIRGTVPLKSSLYEVLF